MNLNLGQLVTLNEDPEETYEILDLIGEIVFFLRYYFYLI